MKNIVLSVTLLAAVAGATWQVGYWYIPKSGGGAVRNLYISGEGGTDWFNNCESMARPCASLSHVNGALNAGDSIMVKK